MQDEIEESYENQLINEYFMAKKKTQQYYDENPEAKKKKKAYDTKYHATPERKKYRAELGRENTKKGKPHDGKDVSHTKSGKTVLESASKNRARNGAGGKSSKK